MYCESTLQVRQVGDHHIARQHVVAFVALGIGIVRVHGEGEMVGAFAAEEEAAGKGDANTAGSTIMACVLNQHITQQCCTNDIRAAHLEAHDYI